MSLFNQNSPISTSDRVFDTLQSNSELQQNIAEIVALEYWCLGSSYELIKNLFLSVGLKNPSQDQIQILIQKCKKQVQEQVQEQLLSPSGSNPHNDQSYRCDFNW